jgi:tripartite-type tricarboxylate transporter receptor subunit TctC
MNRRQVLLQAVATGLAAPAIMSRAIAQGAGGWPNREITMIVAFGPGGGADLVARTVASHMETRLGVPVIVRNMPGASGTIGPSRVAEAKPDGYTIGQISGAAVVTTPLTMRVPYKPWESFDFLGCSAELLQSIVVGKKLAEIRTLDQFIELGRRQNIDFGQSNPGSAVSMFELGTLANLKLSWIPYPNINEAVAAVAGGHLDSMVGSSEVAGLVKSGELRMLAASSVDRWPDFPDVPTLRERGWDTATRQPVGFAAPAGLPPAISERLEAAIVSAGHDAGLQRRWASIAVAPRPLDSRGFKALLIEMQGPIRNALQRSGMLRVE